jgi:hypothetical protein
MIVENPVPTLWVIPLDMLNVSVETIVSAIKRLENIQIWQIDGGVAFSLPDILVKMGRPIDYDAFLERTKPLFRIVDPCTLPNYDALDLQIPDRKYRVRITLKPEETNRRSCRHFKSHLIDWNPFAFRAYASYEPSNKDSEDLKLYLTDWLLTAEKRSVFGESLNVGNAELTDYAMPASARSYPEHGCEVRCSEYSPCTWPWIDLYLRMRRDLPTKKRLSIRFFNEVDPKSRTIETGNI